MTAGLVVMQEGKSQLKRKKNAEVPNRTFYLYLAGLALGSCLLQLPGLGVSLWRDEAATASASIRSLPQLLRLLQHNDVGMTLYYILMHFWTTLFGSSEIVLRLPSLVSAFAITITAGVLAAKIAGRLA